MLLDRALIWAGLACVSRACCSIVLHWPRLRLLLNSEELTHPYPAPLSCMPLTLFASDHHTLVASDMAVWRLQHEDIYNVPLPPLVRAPGADVLAEQLEGRQ